MPTLVAVVVLAVAAVPAFAASSPDFDIDELAEAYPSFSRGLLRYGHHLRRSHRSPAFLKYGHHLHHRHHVSLDEALEDLPMALPGRHPSVEKALDGMAGDLETLKEKKEAAKEVRAELEGRMTDAVQHMNDGNAIRRAMAKHETQLRMENGKLQALKNDADRLGQTQESLMSSLKRMLEPKIVFARERFEKKEKILRKEEAAAMAWKMKKDQLKESAMELINQKKKSQQILLEAEEAVAQAKRKAEVARMKYDRDRTNTGEQVQSYRYAETRYKAEAQHEQAAKAAAMAARESVHKLYNVEHEEQEKVDRSILFRKERLRRKIREVEELRAKSRHELTDLEQHYREWQENQRERNADVVKKSQETAAASVAYASRQQQVLDAAQAKVTREAEGASDWDAWGGDSGMFSKVSDELDD